MRKARVAMLAMSAGLLTPNAATAAITFDYPLDGSIFPPEITAPTFLWRDSDRRASAWLIQVEFADGSSSIRVLSRGEPFRFGDIDPRCAAGTNQPPRLTPEQAASHTWRPDEATWANIKRHAVDQAAVVTITGRASASSDRVLSRNQVTIQTSRDPVGAPIFYRDVPLMPSDLEKGVIKPLASSALPLVSWRLRNVGEDRSRLVMEGLHTCANCHSFSRDGRTMGMDLDGPRSDKGMYALVRVSPQMAIRNEDVVTWASLQGRIGGELRVGFMSQVSPDGRYVVTTINGLRNGKSRRDNALQSNYYVANFKDYRFLQVFYPTRGILAWYSRATGRLQPLPGADDPGFVQTDAVWSADGQHLVFARAPAREPYRDGVPPARYANDPNETPIQYDLYRIPFRDGKGGRPEPISGASRNGRSNTFPKVSPDGRWIVFVQCRNGQLMRPDSQLFIVPFDGGLARKLRCNTPLMNSWHSFSPNGRWLVFSSKSRSPYTQMYLTHLDAEGRDSPAILIENTTAANRAVNLPEFVNIPPDTPLKIDVPAADFYRLFDVAWDLADKGRYEAAAAAWKNALQLSPDDARAHYNLGIALARLGRFEEAILHYRQALGTNPEFGEVHNNLAVALARSGKVDEAIAHYRKALEYNPQMAEVQTNLGVALVWKAKPDEAIACFQQALKIDPSSAEAHRNLGNALYYFRGRNRDALAEWENTLRLAPDHLAALSQAAWLLATCPEATLRNGKRAVKLAEQAAQLSNGRDPLILDTQAAAYAEAGRFSEAIQMARRAVAAASRDNPSVVPVLKKRLALYESGAPFRESVPPSR